MKFVLKRLMLVATASVLPVVFPGMVFASNLTLEQILDFSQNNILYYDPTACNEDDMTGGIVGNGDFAKILTAKNADKSFFNGSGDVPSARWSDSDTGSMRRLLETYGDLAYQLGDAVGAPWIAILVQMRYEDPDSVCGQNNFWGNGCDPSHAYAGGATVQGSNLGEGFVQYGKTLTNGYHDQALGIADAKEYLTAIGPTWVQGNVNGPGYGSIEAMKASVDALSAYAESGEGQTIVKEFGNYHGNGGRNLCRCGEKIQTEGKWKNGWLVDDSIKGMKRDDANEKTDLDETPNKMYGYSTENGRPNKILLHATGGVTNGYAAYPEGNKLPAHFTIDLKKKEGYQHFSLYQPALSVKNYDAAGPIQIEIVGLGTAGSDYSLQEFADEDWDYLAKVLLSISDETGVPLSSTVEWDDGATRLTESEFDEYEGVLGHMHVPSNNGGDPGDIWQYVDAAIQRAGGFDAGCSTGGNGDINATAIELAWPLNEYGQHAWSEPKQVYAKALREVGLTSYGDTCVEHGGSCDAFVATVMRYSGADPDFYCCGVSAGFILSYLTSSSKYVETQNGLGNLRPGDIRIGPHHIELYVEVNGEPRIASASYCDRNGDIGYYYDNDYRVFRLK